MAATYVRELASGDADDYVMLGLLDAERYANQRRRGVGREVIRSLDRETAERNLGAAGLGGFNLSPGPYWIDDNRSSEK